MLRPYLTPVQVVKHKGKRAAVDAYSWLHKGAYSCALELGTGITGGAGRSGTRRTCATASTARRCFDISG